MNDRRRSRSQSWVRPSMCRCPEPSKLPASAVGTRMGPGRLRRTRDGVGHFHIGHAQLVEAVLQKSLFLGREIAFGFLGNHTESIDSLSRANDVNSGLPA